MDIKETKEALIACNVLTIYLIQQFKDGFQLSDFLHLFQKITLDPEFKKLMLEAYAGVSSIPAELKDIDVNEMIELTSLQLGFITEIITAFVKKPDD